MKHSRKKNITFYILYGISYLHALLPFWVLYILSDILFVFLYHVVRYRRKLVKKNLHNAFPAKSVWEIKHIERKFYRHFCDYFVETIKTLKISDKEVQKRMKFENPELINQLTKDGNSCFLCMGHYANWEWITSLGLQLRDDIEQRPIYKELHNQSFDDLFLRIRSRFSPKPIEMNNAFRMIIKHRNMGKTMLIGFLADQRPPFYSDHYWTDFLHQDTLVQTGMERLARKMGFSVVYLDMQCVKRGYYTGTLSVITFDASTEPEFTITEKYMRALEKTILRDPAYYLWTHNRWKFKRQ
ncbi:MAG TPA: acetyltransferase [Porphyromonadaceae bacterium]|nr:acetyltransferase [Porphyromonadaceae bacterium]